MFPLSPFSLYHFLFTVISDRTYLCSFSLSLYILVSHQISLSFYILVVVNFIPSGYLYLCARFFLFNRLHLMLYVDISSLLLYFALSLPLFLSRALLLSFNIILGTYKSIIQFLNNTMSLLQ